jgi:capsular exopolysaccharide synthesis family protein
VRHDYFNFVIKKPAHKIVIDDFNEFDLSFVIHNLDDVANGYLSTLEVNNIDIQASIFKIVSYGAVVDKEVDFLKKLTENYIQNKLLSRNKIATSKESFIRNQLQIISDSLLNAELNLELFKRDQNATNLGATATNAIEQTQNLQIAKAKIQLDIKYYNSLIKYLDDNLMNEDFIVPTAIGLEDPLLNENIIELRRLFAEKTKKEFFVTSNNQEMEILLEQIKESTELLLSNLRNSIKSSELALRQVNVRLANYNKVINSLPMREKQLLSIQRRSTLYENLFNYLSQELAKTGIARAESVSDTRVLDSARMVGDKPVAPQKMLLMVLAVIIGTIIPLAWISIYISDTIQNVSQLKEHTDIQVAASIAHYTKSKELSNLKVKESFRDLSANLKFVIPKDRSCVIGVTSTIPNEGKTFCAINLGITFAETGKKTLVVDIDLRNPSIVNGKSKIKRKGLSTYLQGDIKSIEEIIYPHDKVSNLQYIPTSIVEGNIHKLLSSEKMTSLILYLRDKYECIILDTPAVGLVSDYLMVTELIDLNLFVVRNKVSKITFLKDFENLNAGDKKKKSYIIFNDTQGKDYKYGYEGKYGVNKEPQLILNYLS